MQSPPPDERPYTAGYKAGYAEGFAAGHAAGLRAAQAAAGSTTASTSGWRVLTQPHDGGGAPPPPPGAYVFHCSSETEAESSTGACWLQLRHAGQGRGHRQGALLYNTKSAPSGPSRRRAAARNIAKGALGGRFDLHVAFFDGPYELLFDAAVDSKSGKGPDIGRWTTWESAVAQKRRRSAPRKASPS